MKINVTPASAIRQEVGEKPQSDILDPRETRIKSGVDHLVALSRVLESVCGEEKKEGKFKKTCFECDCGLRRLKEKLR